MWPVLPYLSIDARRTYAVFASGLQRRDEPVWLRYGKR